MKHNEQFVSRVVEILQDLGALQQSDAENLVQSFRDSSQEQFDNFLLEEGLVERDDLLDALSRYYQVPSFDVVGYFFETLLLHKFPKDFLLRNVVVPIEVDENMLLVVASDPANPNLLVNLGNHVSYDIRFCVGLSLDITDAIKEFYDEALTQVDNDSDHHQEAELLKEEHRIELDQAESSSYEAFVEVDED